MTALRTGVVAVMLGVAFAGLPANQRRGRRRRAAARLDRGEMAVPDRPVGHRPRLPSAAPPTAAARSRSTCAPSSASATARPAWPTTTSSTGSATSNCSATSSRGWPTAGSIAVGWMKGRSRPYQVEMRYGAPRAALAIAFNDKCDVVVATVVAERDAACRRPSAPRSISSTAIWCCAGREAELGHRDEIRRPRLSRHQSRARHGARAEADLRPRAGDGLARRHRAAGRHRPRRDAGRLLLRRLSALRRDRGARADHGRGARSMRPTAGSCSASATASRFSASPGCCRAC